MPFDRRTILTATAATAVGVTTPAFSEGQIRSDIPAENASAPPHSLARERIVSLEDHFLVPSLARSIKGLDERHNRTFYLEKQLGDLGAGRLRAMDEGGITVQVLSASPPGADMVNGEEGVRFARATNDRLADATRQNPGRFAGFAHLPMRMPEAAADELERAVSQLGFRGALINGMTDDRFLDDPRFAPVLARAAKLGVPIYIHPNFPPGKVYEAYYTGLPGPTGELLSGPMFGWHSELAIHILRLAINGTFEKHPGLQVIIGHMGEMLPFMLDRADHCWMEMAGFKTPISKVIRDHVYITTSGVFSTSAFLCALTSFGADRILFSVDYPYSPTTAAKQWLDTIPVAPADKLKIMHGNADRLLKLNPSA